MRTKFPGGKSRRTVKPTFDPLRFESLIHSRAWSWNRTTGTPRDELVSEAWAGLTESFQSWNPEQAKLSTWAFPQINQRIGRFVKENGASFDGLGDPDLFQSPNNNPHSKFTFVEGLSLLSQDGKKVVGMAFSLNGEADHPYLAKGSIRRKLRREGWSFPRIRKAFVEIENMLK